MTGYTKLFSSIVASSIWDEDKNTKILWVTMLALKGANQIVESTERFLAISSRLTSQECADALAKLESPDPASKSNEWEGRRIKRVEGGWLILNGERYSQMLTLQERRQYNSEKQKEYRARRKMIGREGKMAGARESIQEGLNEQ